MVVRYTDESGRALADVVHLASERMQVPKSLGAKTLTPLARPVMRGGRTLEAPELPSTGRERALAARAALAIEVTHLRSPATYPVRLSPGIVALRDTMARS
jgi:nicotinate phosphoribosyltransferase